MKIDKETIIVLLIAAACLVGWFIYYPKYVNNQEQEKAKIALQTQTIQSKEVPVSEVITTVNPEKSISAVNGTSNGSAGLSVPSDLAEKLKNAASVELSNELLTVKVNPGNGVIESVQLDQYKTADKSAPILISPESMGIKTFQTNDFAGAALVSFKVLSSSPEKLVLERLYANNLRLIQTLSLKADSYEIACNYQLVNQSAVTIAIPELKVWTCGLSPLINLSGDKIYSERHNLDYCLTEKNTVYSIDPDAKDAKFEAAVTDKSVAWLGCTNKYFASLLFADPGIPFNGGIDLQRKFLPDPYNSGDVYVIPAIAGVYKNIILTAGTEKTLGFNYYCGPKEISRIQQLADNAMDVMHISWFSWFEAIARWLVRFLVWLKGLCGSYGIAIILLTVIVRLVFWPVTQKANNSMRKMQKVGPMVKELKEKYKDNPQLMNQKMMELYRKEGVNPLGGCLPILLQIPVFLALYSALDASVELRHVSFLWATDLTKPDLVGPQFLFGYGIHPLILIMTALMVLQQKMTPSTGADPMQQKMMMFMPIVMLVMLYNLPSGLTLYWTVSQIFSILQMKYTQYTAKREEEKEAKNSTSDPA